MEKQNKYTPIDKDKFIISIKLFGLELVLGYRTKEKDDPYVGVTVNQGFVSKLFDKLNNWLNGLLQPTKKDEQQEG